MSELRSIFSTTINTLSINTFFDIFIISFFLYKIYFLFSETRSKQLIKGIAFIILLIPISYVFKLNIIYFLLNKGLTIGISFIIIVFQPEIRRALEKLGTKSFEESINSKNISENRKIVDSIIHSVGNLSLSKTGALIVIQQKTGLKEIANTGVSINADISSALLENIFIPNTPLHDGATLISGNKIIASGCFLPLSQNNEIRRSLGTRHRAALGLSEVSDSIIIVVSEETGSISLVSNCILDYNIPLENLKKFLDSLYLTDINKNKKFRRKLNWKTIRLRKK